MKDDVNIFRAQYVLRPPPPKNCCRYNNTLQNTKAIVHSHDGNTDIRSNISRALQGDTFSFFLFRFCHDHVLRTSIDLMKANECTIRKVRSRWYPTETMNDADNGDDLVLRANRLVKGESLLNNLEQAVRENVVNVNLDLLCFNKHVAIIS